jgi:hypothetical protein
METSRKMTFSASIKTDFPVGPLTAAVIIAGLKLNIEHQRTGRNAFPCLEELLIPICNLIEERLAHSYWPQVAWVPCHLQVPVITAFG